MLEGAMLPGSKLEGNMLAAPPSCPAGPLDACGETSAPGSRRLIRVSGRSALPPDGWDCARAASPSRLRPSSPTAPCQPPWLVDGVRLLPRLWLLVAPVLGEL